MKKARHVELSGLLLASLAMWWHPLAADLRLASSNDAHTHILLILPLSVALAYLRIRDEPLRFGSRRWLGVILLGTALLLRGLAVWNTWRLSSDDYLSLSIFGFVVWWIGSVILCFGLQTFRHFLFPLCFLFLIVPFPQQVVNWIIGFLQHESALATGLLFHLARVPVTRDGMVLSIPGLDIEVAQSCSSIRSSMMLMVTTLVLAQLFLRSWWRKTLLVVAVIPLSIAKNAVRIFTIVELGIRVDPSFLYGRLHHNGGIFFLGFAVIVVVLLLWIMRKRELPTSLVYSP